MRRVLATDGQLLVSELREKHLILCLPISPTRRPMVHGRGGKSYAEGRRDELGRLDDEEW